MKEMQIHIINSVDQEFISSYTTISPTKLSESQTKIFVKKKFGI